MNTTHNTDTTNVFADAAKSIGCMLFIIASPFIVFLGLFLLGTGFVYLMAALFGLTMLINCVLFLKDRRHQHDSIARPVRS